MRAGQVGVFTTSSVSPLNAGEPGNKETLDEESEDDMPVEFETEVADRIGAEKEGEYVRKLVDPRLPTKEEVEIHKLTGHVNYRNWCDICVRCRGKDLDHKSQEGKERTFPEYSWGYCFPGDEVGF